MCMKNNFFLRLMVLLIIGLGSVNSYAQMNSDQKSILQSCLSIAEMSDQDNLNADGNPVLTILNNSIIPDVGSFYWFGFPAQFKSQAEIDTDKTKAFIVFEIFEVHGTTAEASFTYTVKGKSSVKIGLSLSNVESLWCITRNETENL